MKTKWSEKHKELPLQYPDNILTRKMLKMGWMTVEDFFTQSQINKYLSKETVRKLILHEDNTIGETVFIKIAECLGFSANEIREIGIQRGYNQIINLIGEHKGTVLNAEEEALLSIYKTIVTRRPDVRKSIVAFFESLCTTLNIKCSEDLDKIES
jgi:hypothetical protein